MPCIFSYRMFRPGPCAFCFPGFFASLVHSFIYLSIDFCLPSHRNKLFLHQDSLYGAIVTHMGSHMDLLYIRRLSPRRVMQGLRVPSWRRSTSSFICHGRFYLNKKSICSPHFNCTCFVLSMCTAVREMTLSVLPRHIIWGPAMNRHRFISTDVRRLKRPLYWASDVL